MSWLLAGLTTLVVAGLLGLVDGSTGGAVDEALRWPVPFPLPPGPLGDLVLYGGWIGLLYLLACIGWGLGIWLWSEDVPERQVWLDRVSSYLAVGGQVWPYVLVVLALGAAGAALVEARLGLLGPGVASLAAVVAISLLGHLLTSPGPPGPDAPPPPPPPPPVPMTRTLDQRLAALQQAATYHGQIVADEPLPVPPEARVPVEGHLAVEPLATLWATAADGVVHEHQRRTLELLRDRVLGRRALLLTPRGSGVEVTVAAAILERLAQGATVLAIGPDPAGLARFWQQTTELLGRAPLPWAPRCVILDERRADNAVDPYAALKSHPLGRHAAYLDEGAAPNLTGDVALATPGSIHATLLPRLDGWRTWLATLDLVIVLDADRYRAVPGGQSALVVRRLRRALSARRVEPATLAVGLDIRDPLGTCERLWHWSLVDEQVVRVDGAPSAARRFVLWQPSLDTTADRAGGPRPGDALAEAALLLDALVQVGERPALVTTHAAIARDDLNALQASVGARISGTPPPIVDSFDALWALAHPPTAVVTFAFPTDLRRLEHETRHLGGDQELLLFAITPPTPTAQLLARRTLAIDPTGPVAVDPIARPVTAMIVPPPPPFLATVQEPLLRRHMLQAVAELPGPAESLADLGTDGRAAIVAESLVAERLIVGSERSELVDPDGAAAALLADPEGTERPALRIVRSLRPAGTRPASPAAQLRAVGDDLVAVTVAGQTVQVVDRDVADLLLYPGRIVVHNRRRYVVGRSAGQPLGATVGLQPFAGGRVATARMTSPTVRPVPNASWSLEEIDLQQTGLRARVGAVDAVVEERIEGYRQFSWLQPSGPAMSTGYAEPLIATFSTRALLLAFPVESGLTASPGVLHALEHAVRAVLPLVLDVRPDDVGVTSEAAPAGLDGTPALVVYDLAPGGNGLADAVRERLGALLQAAIELVASCPCVDGCLACIQLPDCRRRAANGELDKAATLRLLGQLLGRQEAIEATLARGTTIATDEQAEAIRQALLQRIFPQKIGLTLAQEERAPMRLYSEDEIASHPDWPSGLADVGGMYDHGTGDVGVVWVRRYPVETITAVIAHEFAHNWQFTGGRPHPDVMADARPFVRTLLVEGFARWVEYKVLEAAGYLSPLRAAESYLEKHPEYPVGLRFFRYLESKHGQHAPIRLFTHGWDGLSLDTLLDESGCQSELLNAYDGFIADWFQPDSHPPPPSPPPPPPSAS